MRRVLGLVLVAVLGLATLDGLVNGTDRAGGASAAADFPDRRISLMAPADPGGGWDETARALQQSIRASDLGPGADVYNVPGAGGTLGLSQLVSKDAGDPYQLMVMGLVMLGAVETNRSPVGLDRVTPIAGLTTEAEAIVVPAKSPFRELEDVVEAMKADPGSVAFGGGSAGGTDQLLVGQLARAAGVEPARTRYVAFSGGGEAIAGILSGSVEVGVSGVSEFTDQVRAGKMRVLAVSTEETVDVGGAKPPTIKQAGYDVVLTNWRGIVAPPDISPEERRAVTAYVERLRRTPAWRKNIERFGWLDFPSSGDAFGRYLTTEQARVKTIVDELGIA